MAFNKTLAQRLSGLAKMSTPGLSNCRISSPSSFKSLTPQNPSLNSISPDPGDVSFFRRILQRRNIFHPAGPSISPEIPSPTIRDGLMGKLKSMDITRDRLRLDGLSPPAAAEDAVGSQGITVDDARKFLRLSKLETVRSKLREIPKKWISHEEFVRVCVDASSSRDEGLGFAKLLDESGTVIVMGSSVFLRPHEVVKAMEGLIGTPSSVSAPGDPPCKEDPRTQELEEMVKKKAVIDRMAESLVLRELWCGLGFFVVQTLGFMRLTFWELSWDVMEPICFYVTSAYCMAGYAFFLRTAREPSFEGFFQSRFMAKQKRLMRAQNFDLTRFDQLRQALDPLSAANETTSSGSSNIMHFGAAHHRT